MERSSPERLWRQLERLLRRQLSPADLRRVQDAFGFALAAHRGQVRDDGTPYMLHPVRVVRILVSEFGMSQPVVIQAALLHDVLEDCCDLTAPALSKRYGPAVASTVAELTKPPRGDRTRDEVNRAYFGALGASREQTRIIKLADKLDNVRDAVNNPDHAKRVRTRVEARRLFAQICPTLQDRVLAGRAAAALATDLASVQVD